MSAQCKTAFARRAEFYDRIVSDSGLSRAAIVVAWRLVNHINDETGECFPSVERLAGQLNINERTVRRGVDQLVAAGWFTKERRRRGGTDDPDNLQGMCHDCHSRKTAIEDGRWDRAGSSTPHGQR